MPVRSKRLFGPVSVTTTSAVVYTCPADETALIKTLCLGPGSLAATTISLYLGTVAAGNLVMTRDTGTTQTDILDSLFLVLEPGQDLRAVTSLGTCTISGYGAELEGVAD